MALVRQYFQPFFPPPWADFFLLPPRFSFVVRGNDLLRLLFFILVALLISSLAKKKSEADKIADERRAQLAAVVESSEDAIFNKALDGTVLLGTGQPRQCMATPRTK